MDAKEFTPNEVFGTLPRTTRGMPLVIGGDPKGNNFLYCNGNSVVIRNINKPSECEIYTEHSCPTTVAKYSPSGFYIASGDNSGKIRIWDTTQKTHLLKAEYQPISGPIRDIAWSADSQRIAVVGEGRERFGHVFLFDTGTSNGSLSGQSKVMNSIDFRDSRPFRLISASEDNTVAIFEGPPFKFKNYHQIHTRFAHCARYAPGGATFASCGADGKVLLFEGVEGEPTGELVDPACKGNAHGGGVYSLCWSPDGASLLTVSGDKTAKVWDVAAKSLTATFTFGKAVEDMQVGCLWQGEHLLSFSLAGFITYLNLADPTKPIRVIKGHNRPITAFAYAADVGKFFTGDSEGHICRWEAATGDCDRLEPKPHTAQLQGLGLAGDSLLGVAMDDSLSCSVGVLGDALPTTKAHSLRLNSQPRGLSVGGDGGALSAVACEKELAIFAKSQLLGSTPLGFESTCVGLHPRGTFVAVGGSDSKCRVYSLEGGKATMVKELPHVGVITAIAWSPDGGVLAVADAARKIVPYKTGEWTSVSAKEWTFHTAKVNCIAWSPDGRRLASGSLDTNIIVWDLMQSGEHPIIIKGAHTMSQINKIAWLGPDRLVSAGQDSNIKQWTLHFG